jgi:hypothetical protein
MSGSLEEDAEVITSDGKKIGKIKRMESEHFFTVYKKGLFTDEEIRVPVSAVLPRKDGSADREPIRLAITEESLKHGFEYIKGQPNSEFMHGIKNSEPKVPLQKPVIHFSPVETVEESNEKGLSSPPVSKEHQAVLKPDEENIQNFYSCDMCSAKFDGSERLQKHRGERHNAPVNI